jgi:hypothetical protein
MAATTGHSINTGPYVENREICREISFVLKKPEALKSLYRSPGYKKNQLVLCKNYVLHYFLKAYVF